MVQKSQTTTLGCTVDPINITGVQLPIAQLVNAGFLNHQQYGIWKMPPLKKLISFPKSQVPTMRRASGAEAVAASWQGARPERVKSSWLEIAYGRMSREVDGSMVRING